MTQKNSKEDCQLCCLCPAPATGKVGKLYYCAAHWLMQFHKVALREYKRRRKSA